MTEGRIRCFHFDSCGIDGDVFELLGEFDQKLEDFPQRLERARELLDHVPAAEREVGEALSILQAPDCLQHEGWPSKLFGISDRPDVECDRFNARRIHWCDHRLTCFHAPRIVEAGAVEVLPLVL